MQAIASDPDPVYYERRAIELIQDAKVQRRDTKIYDDTLIMAIRLLTLARICAINGSI